MRIAVTSQNFRTVTGHAGKSRRFLVFEAAAGAAPAEVERIDLPKEMSFHEFHGDGAHPVDGVDAIITGSCGAGFARRLAGRGIRVAVTQVEDPLAAVQAYAEGHLPPVDPERMAGHQHDHHH
ncbi:MAG: nitrogen fixation protein [Gammaproteobacteria bacterium HGW-Gammaproteobacteria-1]|jgi:predicted Fe-Mo cluster-binding NifX family protein|nr:MAG: nitrogen fixation protein [Gammaproteobacteria bacterium HGW-Gammaproteobacteria-1]